MLRGSLHTESCCTQAVLPSLSFLPLQAILDQPGVQSPRCPQAVGADAAGLGALLCSPPQTPKSRPTERAMGCVPSAGTGIHREKQIPAPAPAPSTSCLLPAVNKPLASSQQRWLRHTNTQLPFSSKINVVFIFIDLQGN